MLGPNWGSPHQLKATPCDLDKAKEDFGVTLQRQDWALLVGAVLAPPRESKYRYMAPGYMSKNLEDDPIRVEDAKNVVYNIPAPECSAPKLLYKVISMILNKDMLFSSTASKEYDVRRLPLGKLGRETIIAGHEVLAELSDVIKTHTLAWTKYRTPFATLTARLSSQYVSIILHVFGKNQTPVISPHLILTNRSNY